MVGITGLDRMPAAPGENEGVADHGHGLVIGDRCDPRGVIAEERPKFAAVAGYHRIEQRGHRGVGRVEGAARGGVRGIRSVQGGADRDREYRAAPSRAHR